jgi:hypothetical protein
MRENTMAGLFSSMAQALQRAGGAAHKARFF